MPRKARLDAPGAVHHIIMRGIERRKIFRTNSDRTDVIDRLATIVDDTQTCPNRQLMAQRNQENGVTLPSVKTNYTERSVTHESEKEETFGREEERIPDVGLPGRIPVAGRAALFGGGLQRRSD